MPDRQLQLRSIVVHGNDPATAFQHAVSGRPRLSHPAVERFFLFSQPDRLPVLNPRPVGPDGRNWGSLSCGIGSVGFWRSSPNGYSGACRGTSPPSRTTRMACSTTTTAITTHATSRPVRTPNRAAHPDISTAPSIAQRSARARSRTAWRDPISLISIGTGATATGGGRTSPAEARQPIWTATVISSPILGSLTGVYTR